MIRPIALVSLSWLSLALSPSQTWADEPSLPAPSAIPETISLTTPDGWDHLPGLSKTVGQSASETEFFGEDEPFASGAMAYGRANRGAFYLTWVDSLRTIPVAENSLRIAFDEIHQAPYLASPRAGSTQEVSYRERIFDGVAEMRFEWAHMSNETVNVVRALGWKDSESRIHLAVAECVLQSESIAESRQRCDTALDALVLTEKAGHQTLSGLPQPKAKTTRAPEDFVVPALEISDTLPSPSMGVPPAQMGDVLYQGPPPEKEDNKNRFIIGIGALLLAVAFWLTTRSTPASSSAAESEGSSDDSEGQV